MEKKLILRGLFAGAVGGLAAWIFALLFAEPLIDRAVAYEDGRAAAQDALDRAAGFATPVENGGDIVSRGVQSTIGLGVGLLAFGLAMGALFAVAYTVCLGRTGGIRARQLSLLLAGAGFVVVFLVPFLKYPANPPAVGNDATIDDRAEYFLLMLIASLLIAVLATAAGQQLRPRFGTWNAALLGIGGYLAAVAVVMLVLQDIAEVPAPLVDSRGTIVFAAFPADVLADFRVYAIGAQVVLWSAIGLVFAPLADRLLASGRRPAVSPPRETAGI
ncbi:MAG TPA: CbtA family protein [Sporichthya sp.]|nr:CbtA family protein [Sporichthya sp.]